MMDSLHTAALATGLGWASGLRLYAVLLFLGLFHRLGWIHLPEHLQVLSHAWVMGAAGILFLVEFLADKIPGFDSLWDSVQTFIRIPAGALLAAGAVGDQGAALSVAAGLLGGLLATGSHFTKAGTRALINTSPEPFSNWAASTTEDVLVAGGLWAALKFPLLFLCGLTLFTIGIIWLLPTLWRSIRRVLHRFRGTPPLG
jgi:hypothetical protein